MDAVGYSAHPPLRLALGVSGSEKKNPGIPKSPLVLSGDSRNVTTTTTPDGVILVMANDTYAVEASLEIPGGGGKRDKHPAAWY